MPVADGSFYLGRRTDDHQPFYYDPKDLTTHAVVVGMTGSGKTGLCIDLLEETALQGIPALMIDPKGDLTNTLLHFPDLKPSEFQPWINTGEARRVGKTIEQAAAETANTWRKGLAEWDLSPGNVRALSNAVQFAIYTPGSDAGIPVSILANLKAPEIPWESNKEILREKISGTVTALLGLVGLEDIDPIRSREHILLSNIFEHAWSNGRDLDLGELILQTSNPPISKLGVFDTDTFFPSKERLELSMLLNNILAAPGFQTWMEGQPLEIDALLQAPDGSPRHSVFYIAHLGDEERMFFISLLYAALETWMRSQTGTSDLRAVVYFDEIFGFMPPVRNPPSKSLMMRNLKQARAFGIGQVLVTQNPSDLDYKALSNAGTWFIGKLQTENDKNRLLDGLQGASPDLNRKQYDEIIAGLGKREFLIHNIHDKETRVFKTRWAMNYLAGPLTRVQIPKLNRLVGIESPIPSPQTTDHDRQDSWDTTEQSQELPASIFSRTADHREQSSTASQTRSPLPDGIDEYFLPNNLTSAEAASADQQTLPEVTRFLGLIYHPMLLIQARVRFSQRKYNLNYERIETVLVPSIDQNSPIDWKNWLIRSVDPNSLEGEPLHQAAFVLPDAPLSDGTNLRRMRSDFIDWVYHTVRVDVRANEELEIYAGPDISQAEFRRNCAAAARESLADETQKITARYQKRIDALSSRLRREKRELRQDKNELSQRRLEEMGTHAENLLSIFSKRRRRISTSLSKRRMTAQARSDVKESRDAIEDYQGQIKHLLQEKDLALKAVKEKWAEIAVAMELIPISPYKKDILIELFGIAWMPFYRFESDQGELELPGYSDQVYN